MAAPVAVVSASMEPNDLTASAKWLPVAAGAAGDEDSSGLGESTVPKARFPTDTLLAICRVMGTKRSVMWDGGRKGEDVPIETGQLVPPHETVA